jgi:hypothetical protein
MTYQVAVEHDGPTLWGRMLRDIAAAAMPSTIESDNEDDAYDRADDLLRGWMTSTMKNYQGPAGTEPTGMDCLFVAVEEATHAN